MPCFQPEIMIINGLDQNRLDTAAIGTQGVRKDLVTGQGAFLRRNVELCKALRDALGEGFPGMGDAGDIPPVAEDLHPVLVGVGHHAKPDGGILHHPQPCSHFLRGDAGGIGYDGIVEIQHQKFDPSGCQQFRGQIGNRADDHLGKK